MKTSIILCFIGILFGVNVTSMNALFFGMPGPIGKLADDIANRGMETKLKLLEKTEERLQQKNAEMATARSKVQSKFLDGIQKNVLQQNNGQITKGNNELNNILRRLPENIRDCYNRKQKQPSEQFQRILGDTIKKCLAGHMDRGKKEMDKNQKNMEKSHNNKATDSDCNNAKNKSECLKKAISNVHDRISKLPQHFADVIKSNANAMTTMRLNMFACVKDIAELIAKRVQDGKQIIDECKAEAVASTTSTTAADETTASESSSTTTAAAETTTSESSSTTTAADETTTAPTTNQSTSETSDVTSTTTQQSDGTTATESVTETDATTVSPSPTP